MKRGLYAVLFLLLFSIKANASSCPDYLKVKFKQLHASQQVDLCQLTQGKPVLIVNTASNCGYTPHFKQLEALHKRYKEQGLVVIGFPSDDFFQEEDEEADTAKICYINYGVTFTMLAPTAVWGRNVNSVFKFLGDKSTSPKWNFYKYLVDGQGNKVQAFSPKVAPDDDQFIRAIDALVANEKISE
ncbi:glutathione peroxidase [Thalassotalea sp. G2M2-11]|uniref:glutathione peroxidase n=1 Tax=Thalassotalea sp. G2M2-11 TaxID=2787627 RepID=UPI0019CFBA69|nr:glutathione peroxidase [Thalassotalea sp. G2M2-11]